MFSTRILFLSFTFDISTLFFQFLWSIVEGEPGDRAEVVGAQDSEGRAGKVEVGVLQF